jgi:hypothetical protein
MVAFEEFGIVSALAPAMYRVRGVFRARAGLPRHGPPPLEMQRQIYWLNRRRECSATFSFAEEVRRAEISFSQLQEVAEGSISPE